MPEIRRVLVTGAAGFIGSHTVETLLKRGYQVTGVDNLSRGRLENLAGVVSHPSFTFINVDIGDIDGLGKALKDIDAIVHLAALTSHKQSIERPMNFHKVNVTGTLRVLREAVEFRVRRFVFASSAAVYGKTNNPPYHEDMPLHPGSPYGASKVAGEAYCKAYHSAYDLETVIFRYMNVFGPRARRDDYSGVMVKFADCLLRGQTPHVFGDGSQSRDFTFVGDIAEANALALQPNTVIGEVLNVGTGTPTTVNEVAASMSELLGRSDIKPVHDAERPWEIKFSWANIDKARKLLGYEPKVKFKEGLRQFLEWCRNVLTP
jgi:UDP-glucose 4-epimerase